MNILKKAVKRAKQFVKDTKKSFKKSKSEIMKSFKRKYTGKKQPKNFLPGKMLAFEYNAIDSTKKFDKKPLIMCLGKVRSNKKHILGLNLNWMPENQRILLASLITEMLDTKGGELEYKDIKPLLRKFEKSPILRQYAIRRISQRVIEMPSDVFMSAAQFTGPDFSE